MTKKMKVLFAGTALALVSAVSFATTTYTTAWYGNPYAYTTDTYGGCYWTYTKSYGGSWGSQFLYVPNGWCQYTSMQVNHTPYSPQATVVLN